MNPLLRSLTLCLALMFSPGAAQTASPAVSSPAASSPAERAALARGRTLVADFYAVRVDRLWQAFTPEVRAEWGTLAALRAFREAGVRTYGAERRVLRERTFTDAGVTYYVRSATFERDTPNVWAVIFGFDPSGRVQLFTVAAEAQEEAPGRVAGSAAKAP